VIHVLEATGISKSYADLEVLRNVSLSLDERERVALLGPSGCGKTTLLRILLGLEAADRGTLRGSLDRAGYLPQDGLLFPWMTVIRNAELPQEIRSVPRRIRRAAVRDMLDDFGLAGFGNAYPHELSGGMRQRAALLRAVMTGCSVLVLDEPFGALDTQTRHRMQDWLANLLTHLERTLLFVTHDLDEALALAGRIVVLSERPGRVRGALHVALRSDERKVRMGKPFIAARSRLLAIISGERHV